MHSMGLNQDEIVSRKEYLKKKKRENRKNLLSSVNKRTWFMLAFILIASFYVVYQFYVYNTKHRLVQTLPDEISAMQDYKIYYVSQTYTYDSKNQLKSMSTTSNEKLTIDEGSGISQINVKNNIVYGILDGGLVKINTNGEKNKLNKLVEKNVKGYSIYENDIYVYLKGDEVGAGIYHLNSKKELEKVISSEVLQLLVDESSIYIVNKDKNIIKYDKNGNNETYFIRDNSSAGIVQDKQNIYFVNIKDGNKLYKIEKNSGKVLNVTKTATISNGYVGMNASSYIGIYDDVAYYINSKDGNKLYKTKIGSNEDIKVLNDNIQILDVINGTIFYKVNGDIGVYRYDIYNGISSQVTSARVLEFKAEE